MKIGLDKPISYSFAMHTQYLLDYVRIDLLRLCGIIHTEKAPSCCEPGAEIGMEVTYQTKWNGQGLADKEFPFSWEPVPEYPRT